MSTRLLTPDDDGLDAAADVLRSGGTVAFPTETVYGLGGDATSGTAVAAIYEAKGRPRFNPLIAHVPDLPSARAIARFDDAAARIAAAFWPGPLTLVLPKAEGSGLSDLATAGLDSVAVRVPDHPLARALLARFGRPVAAPSANRSGHVSPTRAAHVLADLDGRIDAVLDGGATRVGVESTILALLDGRLRILRPGGVTREAIADVAGRMPETAGDAVPESGAPAPIAPGMLASHYAPSLPVRLGARAVGPGEALINFGGQSIAGAEAAVVRIDLSPSGDLREAAAALFGALRDLDRPGVDAIAVAPIPESGLGEAIADRLRRAAAPR